MTTLEKILERAKPQFTGLICRGSLALGTACRKCERCKWELTAPRILPEIITQLIEVVKVQREALEKCQSIIVETECEECGTFSEVRYSIKPIVETLATTDKLLMQIGEGK